MSVSTTEQNWAFFREQRLCSSLTAYQPEKALPTHNQKLRPDRGSPANLDASPGTQTQDYASLE